MMGLIHSAYLCICEFSPLATKSEKMHENDSILLLSNKRHLELMQPRCCPHHETGCSVQYVLDPAEAHKSTLLCPWSLSAVQPETQAWLHVTVWKTLFIFRPWKGIEIHIRYCQPLLSTSDMKTVVQMYSIHHIL